MNAIVWFVFCCFKLFQVIYAPPPPITTSTASAEGENSISSLFKPLTTMFSNSPLNGFMQFNMPKIRIPQIQIPSTDDPSLELVDQQVINAGDLQGEIKTYESHPDPNTQSAMQTSKFTVNRDGLQGSGTEQHYVSTSAYSSSNGDNPSGTVGTFFTWFP